MSLRIPFKMIKRTLYFGNPAYLRTENRQLVVNSPGGAREIPPVKVPIEDIGVVVLDSHQLTITQSAMSMLLDNNVALIACNERHLPQGLMLNLDGSKVQSERFARQVGASLPLKKNLWQQTVRAKILNQARLLELQGVEAENLRRWADRVGSGDRGNLEARAAAYYWKQLFRASVPDFRRGRYETEPNNLLNYGYAILRAIVARSLTGSGLLPVLGIHHHNKYNDFCLADDVMEPYRPFVDQLALSLMTVRPNIDLLDKELKAELLRIPTLDVAINEKRSPLMTACVQTAASLYECFAGTARKIKYPVLDSFV